MILSLVLLVLIIDGWEQGDARRERQRSDTLDNVWALKKQHG